MQKVFIVLIGLSLFGNHLSGQVFMEKGDLKVGLKVTKDGKMLPIDQLCSAFDPITNVPIDLIIPEGSSVYFIRDSIKTENVALLLNFQEPKYINRPVKKNGIFEMSTAAGANNTYRFIDEIKKDTLKITWKVGYDQLRLLDLYPADYTNDYTAHTYKNDFKQYPDTVRYDWSKVDYVENLDPSGLPITPSLSHNHAGLLFVIYATENAVVQMKGYHDDFHPLDTDNLFDLLLYKDLVPGSYEFIAKPYADAPERLWLKYPFTIRPPWWKNQRTQYLIGMASSFSIIALMVAFFINFQKRKEKELRWKQQLTDAELKAIRAQLNPHFLFNALNSIQNLVHQQKNEQANLYITKLSRLLRQVLSSSERPFQELQDELQLTQLYLELEQLRFPFTLQVEVDKTIDKNTLVPTMLLQPYVENAVKHGIAGNPQGAINIKVQSDDRMLFFKILDNGPGLSSPKDDSKGIALGDNRINHLNQLYSNQASVDIKNRIDESGVIVNISLPVT